MHSNSAAIVNDADEEDALIPHVVDDRRDRRGSDASGASMRTSSSAAPPPATTDEEDEPYNHGTRYSTSRYEDDVDISGSEASFELVSPFDLLCRSKLHTKEIF